MKVDTKRGWRQGPYATISVSRNGKPLVFTSQAPRRPTPVIQARDAFWTDPKWFLNHRPANMHLGVFGNSPADAMRSWDTSNHKLISGSLNTPHLQLMLIRITTSSLPMLGRFWKLRSPPVGWLFQGSRGSCRSWVTIIHLPQDCLVVQGLPQGSACGSLCTPKVLLLLLLKMIMTFMAPTLGTRGRIKSYA